ncbi:urease accessory protein UreH domain-containing protein [Methylolobus aquaticus]
MSPTPSDTSAGAVSPPAERSSRPTASQRQSALGPRLAWTLIGALGVGLIVYLDGYLEHVKGLPTLSRDMSFGLLFIVGLFTGFHCVGMCGALVLSYTAKLASGGRPSYMIHLLYGTGKTLSYTAIGAAFGLLGSVVAFTPLLRGVIGIAAGIFLLLFGLGMLDVLPGLKEFRFRTPPFLLRFIGAQSRKYGHPFIIGLLNGLMILCGPLQAMYIMAAGSGSASRGAGMLFFFGLGTLPMMMGFGIFAGLISRQMTPKLIRASAVIVVALGAVMLNRGLKMTGSELDLASLHNRTLRTIALEWNHWQQKAQLANIELPALPVPEELVRDSGMSAMEVHTVLNAGAATPDEYRLHLGMPVRWIIDVREQTADSARLLIPEWSLDVALHPGQQTVNFTPQQLGIVNWTSSGGAPVARFLVEDPRTSLMHVH